MNLLDFNDSVEGGKVIAFKLDDKTEQKLLDLALQTGLTKSAIIRILIRKALTVVKNEQKQ